MVKEEYQTKKKGKIHYIKIDGKFVKVRSSDVMKLRRLYPYNISVNEEGYAVFEYKERVCPECGKKFKPITRVSDGRVVYKESKIYCSQECRLKVVKRRNMASFVVMSKMKEKRFGTNKGEGKNEKTLQDSKACKSTDGNE